MAASSREASSRVTPNDEKRGEWTAAMGFTSSRLRNRRFWSLWRVPRAKIARARGSLMSRVGYTPSAWPPRPRPRPRSGRTSSRWGQGAAFSRAHTLLFQGIQLFTFVLQCPCLLLLISNSKFLDNNWNLKLYNLYLSLIEKFSTQHETLKQNNISFNQYLSWQR